MTVGELKAKLNKFDDNLEVMTKKTEILGNVGYVFGVSQDTYGLFGADIHCVIISDESEIEDD